MPRPDSGNARARMNREQRRRAEKVLAAKVGGKKKLQEMLAEARSKARAQRTDEAANKPVAEVYETETDDDA